MSLSSSRREIQAKRRRPEHAVKTAQPWSLRRRRQGIKSVVISQKIEGCIIC